MFIVKKVGATEIETARFDEPGERPHLHEAPDGDPVV
jgi:hypothetical protein